MPKHRVKEEKLRRIRLGSRYFGFDLGQFYWECLKLEAASEELTETAILRRIVRSWSETLSPTIQEKARAETTGVEAWKAQELHSQKDARLQARLQAKHARLRARRAKSRRKASPTASRTGSRGGETAAASN